MEINRNVQRNDLETVRDMETAEIRKASKWQQADKRRRDWDMTWSYAGRPTFVQTGHSALHWPSSTCFTYCSRQDSSCRFPPEKRCNNSCRNLWGSLNSFSRLSHISHYPDRYTDWCNHCNNRSLSTLTHCVLTSQKKLISTSVIWLGCDLLQLDYYRWINFECKTTCSVMVRSNSVKLDWI